MKTIQYLGVSPLYNDDESYFVEAFWDTLYIQSDIRQSLSINVLTLPMQTPLSLLRLSHQYV